MMNKLLTAGAAVVLGLAASSPSARATNHPFVGSNADKNQIEREDGAVTTRLTPKPGHLDKYNAFISKDFNFEKKQSSLTENINEFIFGKSASKSHFERRSAQWLSQR